MATFLDTGLLEYFSVIFPALLVFVVVYGLFQKIKVFGDNKVLDAIVAIVIAFFVLISEDIAAIISFIAPWFIVLFVFILLLLVVYKMFGVSDKEIAEVVWNDSAILWTIFVISIVIIGAAIATVYGSRLMPLTQGGVSITNATVSGGTPSFGANVGQVLFHPKVIGMIFVLLVSVFSVALLTKEAK